MESTHIWEIVSTLSAAITAGLTFVIWKVMNKQTEIANTQTGILYGQNEIFFTQNKIMRAQVNLEIFDYRYKVYRKMLEILETRPIRLEVLDKYEKDIHKAQFIFPSEIYSFVGIEFIKHVRAFHETWENQRNNRISDAEQNKQWKENQEHSDWIREYEKTIEAKLDPYLRFEELTGPASDNRVLHKMEVKKLTI